MVGPVRRPATTAGVAVVALGLGLSGVHLLHGVEELTEQLPAVVYGTVIPLGVSLLVVAGGVWIARREWRDVSPWVPVSWCLLGLGAGVLLSGLLVLYEAAEGVVLSHPSFVLAMFGTYGGAIGLVLGRYDVQRRLRQREQRRQNERLEEFTRIVSHDLRNPLNVAAGRVSLAREGRDDEHLAEASRVLERMSDLIDDLLRLARDGEAAMEPEPVPLGELSEAVWATVPTDAATLRVETDRTVVADRSRLEQLLGNLFRNAVEHGGGDVRVVVEDAPGGFAVADDGPGVPDERRESVFSAGYTTADDGTGFGLTIVAEIAEAHGWDVQVEAAAGGGARFVFEGVEFG